MLVDFIRHDGKPICVNPAFVRSVGKHATDRDMASITFAQDDRVSVKGSWEEVRDKLNV